MRRELPRHRSRCVRSRNILLEMKTNSISCFRRSAHLCAVQSARVDITRSFLSMDFVSRIVAVLHDLLKSLPRLIARTNRQGSECDRLRAALRSRRKKRGYQEVSCERKEVIVAPRGNCATGFSVLGVRVNVSYVCWWASTSAVTLWKFAARRRSHWLFN